MKKTFIFITLFVFNYAFSQYKYVLEGKIQNPAPSQTIYLEIRDQYSLNEYMKKDSCVVKNGQFRFFGGLNKKSETAKLYFTNETAFGFVLDNGLNEVNVGKIKDSLKSFFSNTKRPRSISNEIYTKHDSLYEIYFEKYATNVKVYNLKKPQEIKLEKMLNNYEMEIELRNKQLELVKHYPNSFYSLIFLYKALHRNPFTRNPTVLVDIFKNLNGTIKNDPLGVEFYKSCNEILTAEKESVSGRPVSNFIIKTDKGNTFNNASLLGNPYVIAFSATWCGPCKQFEPKLKAFYDAYKKNGLEVVYFNLDSNDKKWKEHISKNNLNWVNVSDGLRFGDSPISKQFNVQSIPIYIVVDKKGNIIYNSIMSKDYNFSMLEKYIKKALE